MAEAQVAEMADNRVNDVPGEPSGGGSGIVTISGTTSVYGVWGWPVSHTRSPKMQNAALWALGLDAVYVPFAVSPERVGEAIAGIRALGIVGVNVTVPLKELVPPFLDHLDPVAARLGVVNTIANRNGELWGYTTDGPGLLADLRMMGWPVSGMSVYIFGAGGSARAVADALASAGNRIQIANRTAERAAALAAQINEAFPGSAQAVAWGESAEPVDLVINTTSLGMRPNEDTMPLVPAGLFHNNPRVYDLVYAPEETRLLQAAKESGCLKANGLGMLAFQGALSLSHWTGKPLEEIPVKTMMLALRGIPDANA